MGTDDVSGQANDHLSYNGGSGGQMDTRMALWHSSVVRLSGVAAADMMRDVCVCLVLHQTLFRYQKMLRYQEPCGM